MVTVNADDATERAVERVDFAAENPYEGVDVSELPEWWRANIREFDERGLRTYLPSRFADGEIAQRTVERLETEYNVNIQLIGVNVRYGDDWELRVDGETVASLERRRSRTGYTVFELSSDEFERHVERAVTGRRSREE